MFRTAGSTHFTSFVNTPIEFPHTPAGFATIMSIFFRANGYTFKGNLEWDGRLWVSHVGHGNVRNKVSGRENAHGSTVWASHNGALNVERHLYSVGLIRRKAAAIAWEARVGDCNSNQFVGNRVDWIG